MPKVRKVRGKKVAEAPFKAKGGAKKTVNPLVEKRPKNFSIGGDVHPKRDLSRFVKWPKYIRMQRQKKTLCQRLKVPPAVAQFTNTVDCNLAKQIFKLATKYSPETKLQKKVRLQEEAKKKTEGKDAAPGKKPVVLKYGINHITHLIEQKKAQLVVIAHDVDPIEIVVWLPALCRKIGIPYVIIKGKARLGKLVHKKTATAVAFTGVKTEDRSALNNIVEASKTNYLDRFDQIRKHWGGGVMGAKTNAAMAKLEKAKRKTLQQ
ncbi:large ribosomal subunit protein eL8-like [Sycon ciliatum]|uniref:large ribosomal subunit protein eL8-like n=1 Tax=Sycon ciliatum TaxID=27933 RepID=UPI0031F645A9